MEHRLSHRIKRQGVLHRDSPPSHTAIVHETALRIGFGGPTVTRAQSRHLLEMSELPNVTFRVIPFGQASFTTVSTWRPLPTGGFTSVKAAHPVSSSPPGPTSSGLFSVRCGSSLPVGGGEQLM
ncbi:Scr1 family TA system antitoxin-like transcriptional regulator [Streptomyces longispororuber]|uniref:Scr1 family TA system antitoxin-like transcriptional regulator n=1 Tax=Streptomyces longispororuber TaxID=68230 RepID=UPI0036FDB355